MNFRPALLFLILLSSSLLSGQNVRFYQIEDLDEYTRVLDIALEDSSLMLMVIFEDDGGFEEMVRAQMFDDDSIKSAFAALVPVAIYKQSEMALRLKESFGENKLPSFYMMNTDEFLLNAAYGKLSRTELLDFIAAGKLIGQQLPGLKNAYANHTLSPQEWIKLIGLYELNFDFLATHKLALEYLSEVDRKDLLNDTNRSVSLRYGIDLETPYPLYILNQKEKLDSSEFADFYSATYSFNFDLAVMNEDTLLLDTILEKLIPRAQAPDSLKEEMTLESQKLFAGETGLFRVWENAALKAYASIENPIEKAELIFDEAFAIAEEYNSKSAQQTARQLAKKASALSPDYRYYMLEAYMAYLMKDYDQALEIVSRAIGLAENESDTRKAERLQSIIRSEKGIE